MFAILMMYLILGLTILFKRKKNQLSSTVYYHFLHLFNHVAKKLGILWAG
jgi:hypothetical protein